MNQDDLIGEAINKLVEVNKRIVIQADKTCQNFMDSYVADKANELVQLRKTKVAALIDKHKELYEKWQVVARKEQRDYMVKHEGSMCNIHNWEKIKNQELMSISSDMRKVDKVLIGLFSDEFSALDEWDLS